MRPTFVVPNEGEAQILSILLGTGTPENLTLKLFSNNHKPAESDTASTFTEVIATGYAAKTLIRGSGWTIATVSGITAATYATQTFTVTTATDCYGFYIVGATSGKIYLAQNLEWTDDTQLPIAYRLIGSLGVPPVIPLE